MLAAAVAALVFLTSLALAVPESTVASLSPSAASAVGGPRGGPSAFVVDPITTGPAEWTDMDPSRPPRPG